MFFEVSHVSLYVVCELYKLSLLIFPMCDFYYSHELVFKIVCLMYVMLIIFLYIMSPLNVERTPLHYESWHTKR